MKKILVIEDEPTIRSLITEVLEEENFLVICAENGQQGVECAQLHHPDLILCDVMMPLLDGFGVLSNLRQNPATTAIPFIFLTAKADKFDLRKGMVLGADDYLTKPFTIEELLASIQTRLARQAVFAQAFSAPLRFTSDRQIKASELRKAIDRSEFVLYYQPQISLETGQFLGVEALVRWVSPIYGLVPPAQFIALAEATGLIVALGEWILGAACTQAKQWQGLGFPPFQMAVNLSSLEFHQANLTECVIHTLTQSGLDPHWLDIELSERLLVQNVEAAVIKLKQLKALGVNLSIDDFGTGYASLGYLQHFPLDVLKIDQCFIRGIDLNVTNAAIGTALIQLAHDLQLRVIAEGVETKTEQQFLIQHRCDGMQGFLFSPPIPAIELEKLVLTNDDSLLER